MLTSFACAGARAASAPGFEVRELLRQPLPEKSGTDIEVDYPAVDPRRTNIRAMSTPMCLRARLRNRTPQTFTQGQMWSELPNERNMVSKNASTTQPAKLLVFFIVPHRREIDYLAAILYPINSSL
jgi:hypothetical protein